MQEITALEDLEDGAVRDGLVLDLEHRFMDVRIKGRALGLDGLDAITFEHGEQLAFGHLDAAGQRIEGRIGGTSRRIDAGQRPLQVVGDGEQIAGERGNGVLARLLAVALGAAADVFRLGERPQPLILQPCDLRLQFGEPRVRRQGRFVVARSGGRPPPLPACRQGNGDLPSCVQSFGEVVSPRPIVHPIARLISFAVKSTIGMIRA